MSTLIRGLRIFELQNVGGQGRELGRSVIQLVQA